MLFHILSNMLDPAVVTVLRVVPEFADRYLDLVEEADGDPGAPVAFAELAEFVADLVAALDRQRPLLERCLARRRGGGERRPPTPTSSSAGPFSTRLPPRRRRAAARWPRPGSTLALLDELERRIRIA